MSPSINTEQPSGETRVACPTCRRQLYVPATDASGRTKFFPFCSERCRLIDLNAWLDADYRIVARPDEESEDALAGDESPS
ncbi:DNA gyrase inhibitor YacG [Anaerobaca lacustris]|uniref:DNA gyrase inhibitor YacG n=1 Tax=Anaerobaca lacustris TaxID=3044600 RepID=A0AAW6TZX9_9BACT|nr:DNA gyrase inhibitor YacG [Sedimentisphaerales bacterium M17dextr]